MNNDLISREGLKKALQGKVDPYNEGLFIRGYNIGIKTAIEMLDNAPTVCGNNPKWCENCVSKGKCASTKPHGEWVNTLIGFPGEPVTKCSLCGYDITFAIADLVKSENGVCCIKDYKPNFCPNCGAKMNN